MNTDAPEDGGGRRRRHSSTGYVTPVEFEMQHYSSQASEIQLAAQPVSTLRVKATATGLGESRCVTIYSNAGGTP